MALTFDIGANERAAVRSVQNLTEALEETDDALTDLANAKGTDKLERSFKDLAKEADKAERAVEKVGDGADKGMKRASGATSEFKSEALSNFSEVTSSFDGSMESIGELAQGTLGGVAANIPGIGLAAGAVAIGIGAITDRYQKLAERSKEVTDGIIADFLDVGDALDAEAVRGRVRDILGVEGTRKEAELLAEIMGTTVGQAALAMAGDFEAAGTTAEEVIASIAAAPGDVNYDTWIDLQNSLKGTTDGLLYGQQAANAAADAMNRKSTADLNAAFATGKVTEEVDELGNRLYTLPDGKQIMIDALTGQATSDVDSFKGDLDGIPQTVDTYVRVNVDSSRWDNWRPSAKTGVVMAQYNNLNSREQI